MPHLFMLEPYQPDKKIIVMIHGLASSPETWISLTNNIMGDEVLREHYQVWQVFYSTNIPIFESRFQINALLKQAFVINPDLTVEAAVKAAEATVGAPIKVTGFVRFALGEGIDKGESDFAAEVAAAAGQG